MMDTLSRATFDAPDRLNDDGTVTFRIIPSNWRRYNISPDTYQLVNGDSWVESTIEYFREETGRELDYDDLTWEYDHAAIVRDFGEVLAEWIRDTLWGLGLESIDNVHVVDSWSPAYYNFQSDGFEVELTCDPEELRGLTPDFDADDWAHEWYRSVDGFHSFVTSRMQDDDWRAGYDAEFRVESLLAGADLYDDDTWIYALADAEYEVYSDHVKVEVIEPEVEDSGLTMPDLEEWARELTPTQEETLPLD